MRESKADRAVREFLENPNAQIVVHRNAPTDLEQILGIPITEEIKKKVSIHDEESQVKPDWVICQVVDLDHPVYYQDNIIAACVTCDADIQHRPYAPADVPKICIYCAMDLIKKEESSKSDSSPTS